MSFSDFEDPTSGFCEGASAPDGTEPVASTAKILVIHHERETQLMLTQYLQADGYAVNTAKNWETAFEQLQQQPVDLVILDLAISQQAGGNLLQQLLAFYPAIRVVVICDHCSLEDAVEAMKQGAIDFVQEPHGYLQRPFNPARIQAVVAEALKHPLPAAALSTNYDELITLARQAAQQCDFDRARELIGEALKLAPERPEGLTLLGQITEHLGDCLEALKLYRAAYSLDPAYQPAQENLDRAAFSQGKLRPRFNR
ncbi:response regulator [Nodosilinea nodulosa]|uniref:response regulator n=1 Tax=Nodosilinea nodulosa TaxID=416001 RepID=UPI0003746CDB|nr:response regulator [Nodosilinea nodulosa]